MQLLDCVNWNICIILHNRKKKMTQQKELIFNYYALKIILIKGEAKNNGQFAT